jgi:vacuolar-type H+-ATPase subunit I/STV1
MYEVAMLGFFAALGMFILIWKINLIWFCRYHWQTDLGFAGLVTWLFFGTFSGMATAAVAGVIFSGLLFMAKMFIEHT